MAARAMWKGVIGLGGERVPVKLYAAIESGKVHFRLLHEDDQVPVKQQLVDPITEEPVAHDAIRRAMEVEPGRFVVLGDDDLAALTPPASRDIEVLRFVPAEALDDRWYDRAYWLGPDGDAMPYFALVAALQAEARVGIVRWVMRNKRYQGALRVAGDHLMVVKLNHAEAVVPADAVEAPAGRAPDAREVKLAEQLIEALAGDFDPAEFGDEYQARVRGLIAAKAEGRTPKAAPVKKRRAPKGSLADALEASLAAAGGR